MTSSLTADEAYGTVLSESLGVESEGFFDHSLYGEALVHAASGLGGKASGELAVVQEAPDRRGERLGILWRDEQTRLAVHDGLADPADGRCDDGDAGGLRLDHGQ